MTDWSERDGQLSDGTPLRDVAAEMPVEVREAGASHWRAGVVITVDDPGGGLIAIGVELADGSAIVVPPNYVRRRQVSA